MSVLKEYIDIRSGELLSAKQAAHRKPQFVQKIEDIPENSEILYSNEMDLLVIDNALHDMTNFHTPNVAIVMNWIRDLQQKVGDKKVADMLNNMAEAGYRLTPENVYNDKRMTQYMDKAISFLDTGDFTKDSLRDEMEQILYSGGDIFEQA